jgi:hypothetical protein
MVTSVPRAADTTVASIATCMEGAVRESGECREEYLRCVHGSYVRQWCLKGVEAFYAPLSTCLPVAAIPACSVCGGISALVHFIFVAYDKSHAIIFYHNRFA